MNDTVEFLRKINFKVDSYYLSAGFGLVRENEELPNYNCTFNRKKKEFITNRAKELSIGEAIEQLETYDLIYLTLAPSYLYALDIAQLEQKTNELVYYNSSTGVRRNIISINLKDLQIMDEKNKSSQFFLECKFKENMLKSYGMLKTTFQSLSFKELIELIGEKKRQ